MFYIQINTHKPAWCSTSFSSTVVGLFVLGLMALRKLDTFYYEKGDGMSQPDTVVIQMLRSIAGEEQKRDIDNIARVRETLYSHFEGEFQQPLDKFEEETRIQYHMGYLRGQLSNDSVYRNNQNYIRGVCEIWILLKYVNYSPHLFRPLEDMTLDHWIDSNLSLAILTLVFMSIHASSDDEIRAPRRVLPTKVNGVCYDNRLQLHESNGFQIL